MHRRALCRGVHARDPRAGAHVHALGDELRLCELGQFAVHLREYARLKLQHRDLCAEAAVDAAELHADDAAADDDEALGDVVER